MPHCLPFLGKVRQVLFQKACEINAVMKRKDSNCVGILADQGEAETASKLSECTITLILKTSSDTRYLKNWTRISLNKVDTRLALKCLASQIDKIFTNLIYSDQADYVKDKYIRGSVRVIVGNISEQIHFK